MRRPSGATLLRGLGVLVVATLAVASLTPAPNLALARLAPEPRLGPADAVVVLGAGVDLGGTLGDSSLRRLVHGIELVRGGLSDRLVLLGPAPGRGAATEAELRARVAIAMGIAEASIVVDGTAPTTRAEAARVRDLLWDGGARRILLVTGSHHMPRSLALFERVGFVVLPAPVDELHVRARAPEQRLEIARGVVKEIVAGLYYRLAGYL